MKEKTCGDCVHALLCASDPYLTEFDRGNIAYCKVFQARQKWIPVTERLPEAFVSVLVHMPEERPLPTVHEGYVTNQGTWYAHFFEREPFEVTHWMPLPEPPKVVDFDQFNGKEDA